MASTSNTFPVLGAESPSVTGKQAVEKIKDLLDSASPVDTLVEITTEVVAAVVTPALEKAATLGLLKFCRSCKNHRAADRMACCSACGIDFCDWCVSYDHEKCMCTRKD